jgi:hypothetical protein
MHLGDALVKREKAAMAMKGYFQDLADIDKAAEKLAANDVG